MKECSYSLDSYITLINMSTKKRLLVEGRSDRIHLTNLLNEIGVPNKIKIDTASDLRGVDQQTSKNNRAKIEHVNSRVQGRDNIYFLCDREFREFVVDVNDQVYDRLPQHYNEKSMFWTLGHSLENYFFSIDVLIDAFRYLCFSEYKSNAIEKFKLSLDASFQIIASVTMAAKDMDKSTYPLSVIKWKDFYFNADQLYIKNYAESSCERNHLNECLFNLISNYSNAMRKTDSVTNCRISRGHTGVILLQRIFSACLYEVGKDENERVAKESANEFSTLSEKNISTALSESWSKRAINKEVQYPELLINNFLA